MYLKYYESSLPENEGQIQDYKRWDTLKYGASAWKCMHLRGWGSQGINIILGPLI